MERYKVSGSDLRDFYQEDIQLEKVFGDIERDLRSENRVVCQYIVNGFELNQEDEGHFSQYHLSDVETLEYLSENSLDLLDGVIRGWIEALPELIQFSEAIARRMRIEGIKPLAQVTRELVQNCETLVQSIYTIRSALGTQIQKDPIAWSKSEEESKRAILEAIVALDKQDFVQLADVIEYDLSHSLQTWREHLTELENALHGEQHVTKRGRNEFRSHSMGRKRIAN